MSLPTFLKKPAPLFAPSAPLAISAASTGGVAKVGKKGSSWRLSCNVLMTCAIVSSPTTSAVRKVPLDARPSFLPVRSSTTS